jgi:ABC-type dipeptide/oligopeptide/nickel transport system permease component
MFQYIVKRILIFIPTFLAISLIIFGLSKMAPGDPVNQMVSDGPQGSSGAQNLLSSEENYLIKSKKLGLDKPSFYFAFTSAAYPKDLYKIIKSEHRNLVSRLISVYGNADAVKAYYQQLRMVLITCTALPEREELFEIRRGSRDLTEELLKDYQEKTIQFKLDRLNELVNTGRFEVLNELRNEVSKLKLRFNYLKKNATTYKLYIPAVQVYGFDNQYHTWMFGDYPWFSTVDSTNYRKVENLYKEIGELRNKEESFIRLQKPYLAKMRMLNDLVGANDSTRQYSNKALDSIKTVLASVEEEVLNFNKKIDPLTKKIGKLSAEKDELNKTLKVYAGKGFLRGDFGTSYTNGLPVTKRLTDALFWTILMNLLSILISYLISIPLGVQSAFWKKHTNSYEPLLSTEAFLAAILMVCLFYFYLDGSISYNLFFYVLILTNLSFLLYSLWLKEKANQGNLTMGSIVRFWRNLFRFRLLNLSDNSILVLKLMYVWIWALMFFLFILIPLIAKFLIISIPLSIWGIRSLRSKLKEKTRNFSISIRGIYAKGSYMDNLSTTVLFILYSLPSFWIGTLLIVFFTTKNYGLMYDWFPTSGVQSMELANNPDVSFTEKYMDILYHLFLPTFCITISSFAYLSRQMRGAMLGVLRQDYIRTADSKGLSEHKVIWKHAFRNSLFPIITLFSSVFPRALSGAIAIELIYNVPGMGVLVLRAIGERDWPIVFTVAMLAAILTMIGNLIADILYAVVDPRISFK